jgi:hypothetical protein
LRCQFGAAKKPTKPRFVIFPKNKRCHLAQSSRKEYATILRMADKKALIPNQKTTISRRKAKNNIIILTNKHNLKKNSFSEAKRQRQKFKQCPHDSSFLMKKTAFFRLLSPKRCCSSLISHNPLNKRNVF